MKKCWVFVIAIIIAVGGYLSWAPQAGYEASLDLPFTGDEMEEVNVEPVSSGADYFDQVQRQVKFCAEEPQPAYVQQVSSPDGWLCDYYQLPEVSEETLMIKIMEEFGWTEEDPFGLREVSEIEKIIINDFEVLKWRYQRGKTRLDHYAILNEPAIHLFVSSPYGDGERIEEIIRNIQ